MEKVIQKYRGTKPAQIVIVLEGDGEKTPFQEEKYVLEYQTVAGITRLVTVGKVVPLTTLEQKWFDQTSQ